MSLSNTQQQFTVSLAKLILFADSKGYGLTVGDAYRDPRVHGEFGTKRAYGAASSVHKKRLASDLNLFVDGKYITNGDHPAYIDLGEFWEAVHPLARWGGRFKDANHFSFEFQGFM